MKIIMKYMWTYNKDFCTLVLFLVIIIVIINIYLIKIMIINNYHLQINPKATFLHPSQILFLHVILLFGLFSPLFFTLISSSDRLFTYEAPKKKKSKARNKNIMKGFFLFFLKEFFPNVMRQKRNIHFIFNIYIRRI